MSSGGRVVDAVKGTVNEVNRRLDRQFAIERERRQREIREAKRLQAEAEAVIEQAGNEVDNLDSAVASFVQEHGNPPGDLARPPMPDLRRQLQEAGVRLEAGESQTGIARWAASDGFCEVACRRVARLSNCIGKVCEAECGFGRNQPGK